VMSCEGPFGAIEANGGVECKGGVCFTENDHI
jgi:hypothetical protein